MRLLRLMPGHEWQFAAGVDEAGRGPLAGSVVAAAVLLGPRFRVRSINDSKKLNAEQREKLYERITRQALCYAVGRASVQEIDQLNILQASLLAMKRAVAGLRQQPEFIYVDGLHCPDWTHPSQAITGGDGRLLSIAAASIIAKVERDREMIALDAQYPGYGFADHKGYSTPGHLRALAEKGPCALHRCSFAPIAQYIAMQEPAAPTTEL